MSAFTKLVAGFVGGLLGPPTSRKRSRRRKPGVVGEIATLAGKLADNVEQKARARSGGYTVPLVGEQNYQSAVKRCRVGMPVELVCEPENPHDPKAIVAILPGGATLGYVPKDSFLQRAVHEEGKGAKARVIEVVRGKRGFLEIALEVGLNGEGLGERVFTRS